MSTQKSLIPNSAQYMKIVYDDNRQCNLERLSSAKIPELRQVGNHRKQILEYPKSEVQPNHFSSSVGVKAALN
jgi:hypothetical protein